MSVAAPVVDADADGLAAAAGAVRAGHVVALPTDTLYALAASTSVAGASARLFDLKRRGRGLPLPVLCADLEQAATVAVLEGEALDLARRHWPGPLTLVLPAAEGLPEEVTAGGRTVAVRIPDDPWLAAILREMRAALAAPSANLPGEEPLAGVEAVLEVFGEGVHLALDGGPPLSDRPSTVVDCTGREGVVLRAGLVALEPEELVTR